MKFIAAIIMTFSFSCFAYNSPTVGNRPEKIEEPAWEKRTPASVTIPQEIKKPQKAEKK